MHQISRKGTNIKSALCNISDSYFDDKTTHTIVEIVLSKSWQGSDLLTQT